jgi:hypothetical protein
MRQQRLDLRPLRMVRALDAFMLVTDAEGPVLTARETRFN